LHQAIPHLRVVGQSGGTVERLSGLDGSGRDLLPSGRARRLRLDTRRRQVQRLVDDGFAEVVSTASHIAVLIGEALHAAGAQIDIEAIDAVVFATESCWDTNIERYVGKLDPHIRLRHALFGVLETFRLQDVAVYGNWMSACANLGTTVALAAALVRSGQHRRVLVLVGDRNPPASPRILSSGTSALSDMAIAFIVTAEVSTYRVDHVVSASNHRLAGIAFEVEKHPLTFLGETRRSIRLLINRFRDQTGGELVAANVLIAENFHSSRFALLCDELGLAPEVLHRGSRSRYGHAGAADTLLNLAELESRSPIRAGETIALLTFVNWAWSVVALTKLQAAASPPISRAAVEKAIP
jgi:3-oxoacyl-[acyl-carrier-protein] synthase III